MEKRHGQLLTIAGQVLVARRVGGDDSSADQGFVCDDGWGESEAEVVCKVIARRYVNYLYILNVDGLQFCD